MITGKNNAYKRKLIEHHDKIRADFFLIKFRMELAINTHPSDPTQGSLTISKNFCYTYIYLSIYISLNIFIFIIGISVGNIYIFIYLHIYLLYLFLYI